MAELPARVKVGPFVYTVDQDVEKLREHARREDTHSIGLTDRKLLTITIDPTAAPGQQRDTLWHEIKHIVAQVVNYRGRLSEEDAIETMSPMEVAALRDNPAVAAFLLAADEGDG